MPREALQEVAARVVFGETLQVEHVVPEDGVPEALDLGEGDGAGGGNIMLVGDLLRAAAGQPSDTGRRNTRRNGEVNGSGAHAVSMSMWHATRGTRRPALVAARFAVGATLALPI
jgi:hypothetical protein